MFFYKDYSCPVCEKNFTQDDDVVSCPVCGAPHHRSCWQKEGNCKLSHLHGTPDEWSREKAKADPEKAENSEQNANYETHHSKTKKCSNCGSINTEFAEFCFRCGKDLEHEEWNSVPFHRVYDVPKYRQDQTSENGSDPSNAPNFNSSGQPSQGGYGEYTPFSSHVFDSFGGVSKDELIGEHKAEEVAWYVGSNTSYYLPRFRKLAHQKSNVSWNWAAFFFAPIWLLFRKNKIPGIIVFLFSVAASLFSIFVLQTYFPEYAKTMDVNVLNNILDTNPVARNFSLLLFLINSVNFIVHFIFGLFGNALYYTRTQNHIKYLRAKHYGKNQIVTQIRPEYRNDLTTEGGVSFHIVAITIAVYVIAQFIYTSMFLR